MGSSHSLWTSLSVGLSQVLWHLPNNAHTLCKVPAFLFSFPTDLELRWVTTYCILHSLIGLLRITFIWVWTRKKELVSKEQKNYAKKGTKIQYPLGCPCHNKLVLPTWARLWHSGSAWAVLSIYSRAVTNCDSQVTHISGYLKCTEPKSMAWSRKTAIRSQDI